MALLVQTFCGDFFLSEFVSGYFKTKKGTFFSFFFLVSKLPVTDFDKKISPQNVWTKRAILLPYIATILSKTNDFANSVHLSMST